MSWAQLPPPCEWTRRGAVWEQGMEVKKPGGKAMPGSSSCILEATRSHRWLLREVVPRWVGSMLGM